MKLLRNLTIRAKLLLILVLPVLGLGYFALHGIAEKRGVAAEMAAVESLAQFAVRASALVHETQKERGATAGFLGSKGQNFGAALRGQRRDTDQRAQRLREYLAEHPLDLDDTTRRRLQEAVRDLDGIDAIRARVDDQSVPAKEAIGYYTALNGAFLDVIGALVHLTGNGEVVRTIAAYESFLLAKERAGVERAVMSNTFAADRFGPGMFTRFTSLVAEQEAYLDLFRRLADPDALAFHRGTMTGTSITETERMRKVAFERGSTGGFGIDAKYWFDQQTAKIDLLKTVEDHLSEALIDAVDALKSAARRDLAFYLGTTVGLILASALLALLMIAAITGPLKGALSAMLDIAEGEGDLTRRLDASGRDEVAGLADAFNRFADKLQGMLVSIKEGASSIAASTAEIANGNADLSQRTEEQASSLEETASSMEQMTATVKQNADNAIQANQLTDDAHQRAQQGGAVVNEAVAAMAEINASSRRITEIITVIDEIAFQTNLLALNAAVEAARAGEQGRGFAVVAGEVRTLAQRSATAAKEIKDLIQDSVGKVENGSELVGNAGESLAAIVVAVKRVSDIVAEITAASREQAAGIDQVNKAVVQMDEVTQQNAALVEEAAAASRSMDDQARELMALIGVFKLAAE